jgi:hypothetical protein
MRVIVVITRYQSVNAMVEVTIGSVTTQTVLTGSQATAMLNARGI